MKGVEGNEVDEMGRMEGKHPSSPKTQFPAKQSNMWCATCNVILNVMVESKAIDPSLSNDNPSRPTTS